MLLDRADDVRDARLGRGLSEEVRRDALRDAEAYRQLGLTTVDATRLTVAETARQLATAIALNSPRSRQLTRHPCGDRAGGWAS